MSTKTKTKGRRTGRPPLHPKDKFEEVQSFRCHQSERAYIQQQAAAAGMNPGAYCRRRVLGLPLTGESLKLDPKQLESLTETLADRPVSRQGPAVPPGLLHELSRASVRFADVGNLVNQLAREWHTDQPFSHELGQVLADLQHDRAVLAEVIAKVGIAFDD